MPSRRGRKGHPPLAWPTAVRIVRLHARIRRGSRVFETRPRSILGRNPAVSGALEGLKPPLTDDAREATGRKLYLQLKSGDSYLRKRKRDGAEIFTIRDERHANYRMNQPFPVLLVIRNSEGEVRWMEVRDWLKRETGSSKKPVKQIVFKGERFDVMSVRRWREKALRENPPE